MKHLQQLELKKYFFQKNKLQIYKVVEQVQNTTNIKVQDVNSLEERIVPIIKITKISPAQYMFNKFDNSEFQIVGNVLKAKDIDKHSIAMPDTTTTAQQPTTPPTPPSQQQAMQDTQPHPTTTDANSPTTSTTSQQSNKSNTQHQPTTDMPAPDIPTLSDRQTTSNVQYGPSTRASKNNNNTNQRRYYTRAVRFADQNKKA